MLCHADTAERGTLWACPMMIAAPLDKFHPHSEPRTGAGDSQSSLDRPSSETQESAQDDSQRILFFSPDPPHHQVQYWLGRYHEGKFVFEEAQEPNRYSSPPNPWNSLSQGLFSP